MLHNFQHLSTDEPLSSKEQDRCNKGYKNGCDYYEYGKLQAKALEQIFRICGSGSRFTRYYKPKDEDSRSVEIEDEVYYRQDLKGLGFCSQDGYKYTAAVSLLHIKLLLINFHIFKHNIMYAYKVTAYYLHTCRFWLYLWVY